MHRCAALLIIALLTRVVGAAEEPARFEDGPQAIFAAVVCVFCLIAPFAAAKMAGYDIGSAVGLYAGSQTISASMGLARDAVNRLEVSP